MQDKSSNTMAVIRDLQRRSFAIEADVCKHFVEPLLSLLGYDKSDECQILRQHRLDIPFPPKRQSTRIGRSEYAYVIPDYVLYLRGIPAFVLDAKHPTTENVSRTGNVDQVRSYAIHHQVQAPYFVVTNAVRTLVFRTSTLEPALDISLSVLHESFAQLYDLLSVASIYHHAERLVRHAYEAWAHFGTLLDGRQFDYIVQCDLLSLDLLPSHLAFLYINSKTAHIHGFAWESRRLEVFDALLDMLDWPSRSIREQVEEAILKHCSPHVDVLLNRRLQRSNDNASRTRWSSLIDRIRRTRQTWLATESFDRHNQCHSFRTMNEYHGINPYEFELAYLHAAESIQKDVARHNPAGALTVAYRSALLRRDYVECTKALMELASFCPKDHHVLFYTAACEAFAGNEETAISSFRQALRVVSKGIRRNQAINLRTLIGWLVIFIFFEYDDVIRRPLLLAYKNDTRELRRRIHVAVKCFYLALCDGHPDTPDETAPLQMKIGQALAYFGLSCEALWYLDKARAAGIAGADEAYENSRYTNWAAQFIGSDNLTLTIPNLPGVPVGDRRDLWREFLCYGKEMPIEVLEHNF